MKSNNNDHLAKFSTPFSNVFFMIKYILHCKKGGSFLVLKCIAALFNVLIPLILVRINGDFINALVSNAEIEHIITLATCIILIPISTYFVMRVIGNRIAKMQRELEIQFSVDHYWQFMNMEYELLEQPEIQVKKIRAGMALFSGISIIDKVIGLFSSIITIVAASAMLDSSNMVVIGSVVLFEIVAFYLKKNAQKTVISLDKEKSKQNMVLGVYQGIIDSFDTAKEIRMLQIAPFLTDFFVKKRRDIADIEEKERIVLEKPNTYSKVFETIRNVLVYGVAIYRFIYGKLTIGSFTVLVSYIRQIASAVSSFVNSWLTLEKNSIQIQEYIDFSKLVTDNTSRGELHPFFDGKSTIEFVDVSFKYPGSDKWAIKNCNIKITNGEKLCVVGANGSGKSTFVKLLSGLYNPTHGQVLLNGINITMYDMSEYRAMISAVFQDYALYPFTIKENIVLSQDCNIEELYDVLKKCNLTTLINSIPFKENTYIGKEIYSNGITPSGGESQKIAIARALYHNSPIYILDEPTAALDPMAEYEIYTQFANMIADKCAVLITHRLSAVQLADKVAVFADGQVAEYGTHAELYAKGGIYTEMFDKQAQFYRNEAPATENAQEQ